MAKRFPLGLRLLFILLGLLVTSPQTAHAGFWSDLKNGYHTITELPDEVNELKENYQSTVDKLEETRLLAEKLQKQNEQLTQALDTLQQADQQKTSRLKKVRVTIYTAAVLLVGYFFFVRIIRVVLRRKSYKSETSESDKKGI